MPEPSIAVVIPTLNEEESLLACLQRVAGIADHIVISDGGSRDGTVEVAERFGARIVSGKVGRGRQLNAGVAACEADIYLFLHADTLIPEVAAQAVRHAIAEGAVGGGFLIRFDQPRPIYRFGSAMVNLRTRLTRLPLGDQAQFAARESFSRVGGFRDWPILEDLDFIRRLKRLGKVAVVSPFVETSARRFQRYGPVKTTVTNWLIFALFALGIPPARLQRLYPPAHPDAGRQRNT